MHRDIVAVLLNPNTGSIAFEPHWMKDITTETREIAVLDALDQTSRVTVGFGAHHRRL
jgi:hypothetical protein